jgi:hypothetical protein
MTLSFYAKSDSNRTQSIFWFQNYGSGGSESVAFSVGPTFNTTTSWQRFTFTATSPNNTGKTIGANAYAVMFIRQAVASGSVLDVWGVQMEYGSVATPFQTASGSTGGSELELCQRYYIKLTAPGASNFPFSYGYFFSATSARTGIPIPCSMRTTPTMVGSPNVYGNGSNLTPTGYTVGLMNNSVTINAALASGGTSNHAATLAFNGSLELSAEL